MAAVNYFDQHGRCVPGDIVGHVHKKTRRYFLVEQPKIDYEKIHARCINHLNMDAAISVTEFSQRAEKILAKIQNDPLARDILNGIRIPFMLPKTPTGDLGTLLDSTWIKAVADSFLAKFPDRQFTNHHKEGLTGKLHIIPGSRHKRLIDSMATTKLVGYYFPCLTEYSIPAAIEQVEKLPEYFLLAGGFDTAAALIGSPDLLLRTEGYPPLLWFAALAGERAEVGYHFEAYGYNLTFNRRAHFGNAAESWTSGLVVLG